MSELVVMSPERPAFEVETVVVASLDTAREAEIVAEIQSLLASAEHSENQLKAAVLAQVARFVRVAKLVAEVKTTLPHGALGDWLRVKFGKRVKTIKRWLPVVSALQARQPDLLAQLPSPDSATEQLTFFGEQLFKLAGLESPEDFKLTRLQKWGVAANKPPKRVRAPRVTTDADRMRDAQQRDLQLFEGSCNGLLLFGTGTGLRTLATLSEEHLDAVVSRWEQTRAGMDELLSKISRRQNRLI